MPPSGAQAGTLARPHTHAGASAHASHAEYIGTVRFQGVGFMICVYLFFRNIALRSGNRNHSINRRGGARSGGGRSAMPFGIERAAFLTARGGARGRASKSAGPVHKRAHWRVCTRTPARLHTHLALKTPAPSCSGPGVHNLRVFYSSATQRKAATPRCLRCSHTSESNSVLE